MATQSLVGLKFGRLSPVELIRQDNKHSYWRCRCDCGNEIITTMASLKRKNTTSCGCYAREAIFARTITHGESKSRLYRLWRAMLNRCYNKNNIEYHCYGERGIRVYDEWKTSYVNFRDWAISHGYENGLTLDRIDNNKNYFPENCRWLTLKEQNRNRRNNHNLTYNGVTHCISEWAEILGFSRRTISRRLERGWSIEDTLSRPERNSKQKVMQIWKND